jgi:hypothetical protein
VVFFFGVIAAVAVAWFFLFSPGSAVKSPAPAFTPVTISVPPQRAPEPAPVAPTPAPPATVPVAAEPSPPPPAPESYSNDAEPPPPAPTPATQHDFDLGEITFTDGVPLTYNLGDGLTCILTPQVLDDGNLKIAAQITQQQEDGSSNTISSPQIITRPGQTAAISVSDGSDELSLKLTPKLAN